MRNLTCVQIFSRAAVVCSALFILTTSVLAELPSKDGQVWGEYPLENAPPDRVIELVKKQTGEEAWSGKTFGMINYDGEKMYVYHNPEVQKLVYETIGRFARPSTKDVQFLCSVRFVSSCSTNNPNYRDVKESLKRYLNPVLDSSGKPITSSYASGVYWVAKEDIEKFQKAFKNELERWQGDSRSSILTAPLMTIMNGQQGTVEDVSERAFVTKVIPVDTGHGVQLQAESSTYKEGSQMQASSLLSWDGKSVTSDFFCEFSKVTSVSNRMTEEDWQKGNLHAETPVLSSVTTKISDITWPADGMLVIIQSEARLIESRSEAGVPVLNKVPYVKRLFTNTSIGRDTQMLNGIFTIQKVAE
ncbi:MAG: hypothetical protein ACRC2T_01120 [Thermoguttaceae bacterium]